MTDAGWAIKKVLYIATDTAGKHEIVRLLKAEHARAVRIVKRIGTKKCPDWLPMTHYDDGYIRACEHILTALQRGRGGKG